MPDLKKSPAADIALFKPTIWFVLNFFKKTIRAEKIAASVCLFFLLVPHVLAASNLLENPGAEVGNLSGWTVVNGGSGWSVTTSPVYEGSKSFIASYNWGKLSQEIDLVSRGLTESVLDSQPEVNYSTFVRALTGFKTGCDTDPYSFKIELRNAGHTAITSFDTGNQNASSTWTEISGSFNGYGTGLRYIYFEQRGSDCEFWLGNYGSIFDNASLSLDISNSVPDIGDYFFMGTLSAIAWLLWKEKLLLPECFAV